MIKYVTGTDISADQTDIVGFKYMLRSNQHSYQYFGYEVNKDYVEDKIYYYLAEKLFKTIKEKGLELYYFAISALFSENTRLMKVQGYWSDGLKDRTKLKTKSCNDYLRENVKTNEFYNTNSVIDNKLYFWTLFPIPSERITMQLISKSLQENAIFLASEKRLNAKEIIDTINNKFAEDINKPYFSKSLGRGRIYRDYFLDIILKNPTIFGSSLIFPSWGWDYGEIYLNIVSNPEIGKFDLEKES